MVACLLSPFFSLFSSWGPSAISPVSSTNFLKGLTGAVDIPRYGSLWLSFGPMLSHKGRASAVMLAAAMPPSGPERACQAGTPHP